MLRFSQLYHLRVLQRGAGVMARQCEWPRTRRHRGRSGGQPVGPQWRRPQQVQTEWSAGRVPQIDKYSCILMENGRVTSTEPCVTLLMIQI